jgi:hypothetical protein
VQRDYILRMIEQVGAMLARLRQRILGGDPGAPAELNAEAARQGVDLELARLLDEDSLLLLLSPGGRPEAARCWVMAEFLYLDGLQMEEAGRLDESRASYRRALRLFRALDPAVIGGLPEAAGRAAEMETRLRSLADGGGC